MSTVTTLSVPGDGWTVDDLPDDVDFRYELVDGALLVSPPPRLRHSRAAGALHVVLAAVLPPDLRVDQAPGVHFDRRNYREPDVVVYRAAALERDQVEPADVVLAVEVMSPSSVSTDRVTKPAQYAAAGIAHFWRLELDPLVLVVHRLVAGGYAETLRAVDEVDVDEPLAVRFRLADLLR